MKIKFKQTEKMENESPTHKDAVSTLMNIAFGAEPENEQQMISWIETARQMAKETLDCILPNSTLNAQVSDTTEGQ